MGRILVIDDDPQWRHLLERRLRREHHEVQHALTLADGIAQASAADFDIVLLDVRLPDGNGLDALPTFQMMEPAPEVIFMTGLGEGDSAEHAINAGAWDYVEKSASADAVLEPMARALRYREQRRRRTRTLSRGGILGNSLALRACLDRVAEVAPTELCVLITGESGTGKELFARAVHTNSRRATGPFVVVDCTALPESLAEGLLFGHERGVYTGAHTAREGLIAQAGGGTLFLDEIGELPLSTQKKFLRVLQERRYRPLGSKQELAGDFRTVAATNRDLDHMVAEGAFRHDLLYRLRACTIELPPLRERGEDIALIARHYVPRFAARHDLGATVCSNEFLETLPLYDWPGNVRELVHTLDEAVVAAGPDAQVLLEHLPRRIRAKVVRAGIESAAPQGERYEPPDSPPLGSLHEAREQAVMRAERTYLRALMAEVEGDVGRAAEIAQLSRSRLYALLRKHSIQ